jgi:hypothetical protein
MIAGKPTDSHLIRFYLDIFGSCLPLITEIIRGANSDDIGKTRLHTDAQEWPSAETPLSTTTEAPTLPPFPA